MKALTLHFPQYVAESMYARPLYANLIYVNSLLILHKNTGDKMAVYVKNVVFLLQTVRQGAMLKSSRRK